MSFITLTAPSVRASEVVSVDQLDHYGDRQARVVLRDGRALFCRDSHPSVLQKIIRAEGGA